jgi:CRP/FNR family cyclic AMP-dependent transcriptional regulator
VDHGHRVNEALRTLEAQGTIRVEYGGLRVIDLAALRHSTVSSNNKL